MINTADPYMNGYEYMNDEYKPDLSLMIVLTITNYYSNSENDIISVSRQRL